ncbi:hypothetical protein EAH81_11915 [Flavobacterium pectinovorum]|uniref:Uncharacterized protein n=1 Tax=Flavobacterium pectinovorum TaxID=29533 RepID=A0A502ET38_9FLAO|nr:hypothetical protein EAH81_11915 [Flavobacterium pectinovorum]
MEFIELVSNLLNLSDPSNLFKIHFERFTDKNEYLGERIKSFLSFTILTLFSIASILVITFLIYKLLKRL